MSVIFQALEKLRQSSDEAEPMALPEQGERAPFRRLLLSRTLVITLVVLLFAGGFASIFAVQYLKMELQVAPSVTPNPIPVAANPDGDKAVEESQAADSAAAIARMDGGKQETPASGDFRNDADSPSLPPIGADAAPRAKDTILDSADSPPAEVVRYQPPRKIGAGPLPEEDPAAADQADSSKASDEARLTAPSETVPADPQENEDTGAWIAASRHVPAPMIQSQTVTQQAPRMAEPDPDQRAAAFHYKTLARHAARKARVTAMVHELHAAMERMDKSKTEAIMADLAGIKGEDDPYILKLQAYWLLRMGRYTEAAVPLTAVLASSPEDLEAGINMAVVEIKTGRLHAARGRLQALNQTYPENGTVWEMLQKVQ